MNDYFDLVWKNYNAKKQKIFNWAGFYHFLNEVIDVSCQKSDYNTSLGETIEVFFVITDLIDDLMDNDKKEVNVIRQKSYLVKDILIKNLQMLKTYVSDNQYDTFLNYINCSLYFQYKDVKYQINKDSTEKDYFELVKRSVYLVQSIAFLVNENVSGRLLTAIEYYATSSQIINDLNDLKKIKSYDVLDKKGTLPIIKSVELAKENKELNFIGNYVSLSRFNCSLEKYDKVMKYIQSSGAIEYCQLMAFYYHKKAKVLFIQEAPSKKKRIENYFDSLWR